MPTEAEIRRIVEGIVDRLEPPLEAAEPRAAVDATAAVRRVAVGADHGGFRMKEFLAFRLKERGIEVVDCGTDSEDSVDYPDLALAVAEKVAAGECEAGIIVDGAGIGSAMVANKLPGVRAAPCHDVSSAHNSREHNHANVLTLGAGFIGHPLAWQIVEAWLDTEWATGRHARRVALIDQVDADYRRQT